MEGQIAFEILAEEEGREKAEMVFDVKITTIYYR